MIVEYIEHFSSHLNNKAKKKFLNLIDIELMYKFRNYKFLLRYIEN